MKKLKLLERRIQQSAKLATKALKDKPTWKPAKGYKYLQDLEPGTKVTTSMAEAVLINVGGGSCTVIVTEWFGHPENAAAYTGKRQWALETEVKEV